MSWPHRYPNATLKSWLLDTGSLTKKLVSLSQGNFRVQVLQQSLQRPRLSECRALKISSRRWAVVREVILYGNSTPWVYARTVIPLSSLKGELRRLHDLGNRPLGGALFSDPSLRREALEIAPVLRQHLPTCPLSAKPAWGRRSLFLLKRKPLLVAEIFLDDLL